MISIGAIGTGRGACNGDCFARTFATGTRVVFIWQSFRWKGPRGVCFAKRFVVGSGACEAMKLRPKHPARAAIRAGRGVLGRSRVARAGRAKPCLGPGDRPIWSVHWQSPPIRFYRRPCVDRRRAVFCERRIGRREACSCQEVSKLAARQKLVVHSRCSSSSTPNCAELEGAYAAF
jgi:hypothetical protein